MDLEYYVARCAELYLKLPIALAVLHGILIIQFTLKASGMRFDRMLDNRG